LPDDILGLRCDISCDEGYYLPLGAQVCKACDPGFYSVGGGRRITDWTPNTLPYHFVTYCTDVNDIRLPSSECPGWVSYPNNLALYSGNLTDNQNSILELTLLLVIPGKIHFTYLVDCEPKYDFMTFSINDVMYISNASNTIESVDFEKDLTSPGFYTFKWVYRKDFSVSQGKDAAFLQMLEIRGIDYANSECTPCPVATFNNESASENCYECPEDTYSAVVNATECQDCDPSQYSFPGCLCADFELLTNFFRFDKLY